MSAHPTEIRHCIKCGTEIGPDDSMCRACNRAGMATPSATQYHGTIVVAIVVAVAGLAWAAGAALEGVGPYSAAVHEVAAAEVGYDVTYTVRNEGTKAGRAKCQVVAVTSTGRAQASVNEVTVSVPPGETVHQTASLPGLAEAPDRVRLTCS